MSENPSEILKNASKTFETKGEIYGESYKDIGVILDAIFPDGITLKGADDFSRLYALVMCQIKLTRYAKSLGDKGHKDSAHDCIVYAAILESFTTEGES